MDERLVGERDEPGRDVERRPAREARALLLLASFLPAFLHKTRTPVFRRGFCLVPVLGDGLLEATNSAPAIDNSISGGLRKESESRGGVISISTGRRSPVRSFSSGTIAPLCRPTHHRVRMRSSRSSHAARVATPSASVLAVPPGLDGFLRGRPFRIVRRAAGLLRPAAGHGVRQVSGSSDDSAQVAAAGSLPTGAHPSKRSPPQWPLDRHRRPCSRGTGVHRPGIIH
jgi:hypothetical protein